MSAPVRIGVISDTHGFLDPRVHDAFQGVTRIIHAGDVGRPEILWELGSIAPVVAVRGNMDVSQALELRPLETFLVEGCRIVVVHDRHGLSRAALPSDACAVVSGHTHVPMIESWRGALSVNPGSAARPRGGSRRSVAILEIEGESVRAHIVALDDHNTAGH